MSLKTIGILIESENENDIDIFYGLLIEKLEFKGCKDNKPFPFTMLIKESEAGINEIYDNIYNLEEMKNLNISNFILFDVNEMIHKTKEECEE